MTTYTYTVEGTAAGGQTYTTTGTVATEHAGSFPTACEQALRASFEQLTDGKAVYGQPGVGCSGPYTITKLTLERTS